MGPIRAVWRFALLSLVTPLAYFVHLGAGLAGHRARAWVRRMWARSVIHILGVRIETRGEAPEAPFVLVTNHVSYLDIIVLMSAADGIFVAKSEIASWPVMGVLSRSAGTIFVERTRKSQLPEVLDRVLGTLSRGTGVVFFPEGTSSRGASVLPFKASLFEVALRAALPVHTASIRYETPAEATPAWLSVAWWGDMTFFDHFLRLLTLPRIRARITFGATPITGEHRKTLASATQRAVTRDFEPMAECEAQ